MRDPIPGRISGVLGRAFTMIELMVVIMIIALLVSILLPSVNAVRVHAKVAQCKTLLYTLESGLNMFKTDERLGKQYPPSWHSASNGQDDPYDLGHPYQAWGAQTMVWAVVGADLNGPPVPGFDSDKGLRELYSYTDDDPPQPNHERRGPFADPSSLEIVKPDDAKCAIPWADFNGDVEERAPVILDGFGMPVLYFSKTPRNAGWPPTTFLRTDNRPFLDAAGSQEHAKNQQDFSDWIRDERSEEFATGGQARPHNYDSFLLISAGPDMTYGTGDDVANFPVPKE